MIRFKSKVVKHSMSPIFVLCYHTDKEATPLTVRVLYLYITKSKQYPLSSLAVLLRYLYSRHLIFKLFSKTLKNTCHYKRKDCHFFLYLLKENHTQQKNECIGRSFNHQDLISYFMMQQSLDLRARSIHVNQNF